MKRMPIVYVAGPYRGLNHAAIELNIQSATAVGLEAIRKGWSPIIPHKNTGHLDQLVNLPDQFWLDATMELMLRCDAVVLCPGHDRSVGTAEEVRRARARGIPIYATVDVLPRADEFTGVLALAGE